MGLWKLLFGKRRRSESLGISLAPSRKKKPVKKKSTGKLWVKKTAPGKWLASMSGSFPGGSGSTTSNYQPTKLEALRDLRRRIVSDSYWPRDWVVKVNAHLGKEKAKSRGK